MKDPDDVTTNSKGYDVVVQGLKVLNVEVNHLPSITLAQSQARRQGKLSATIPLFRFPRQPPPPSLMLLLT